MIDGEPELLWLFEEYQSEIGMRSVQGSFEAKLGGVFATNRWESEDIAFEAVRRAHPIVHALNCLSGKHRRAIRLAYEQHTWPPDTVGVYGRRLAGIVQRMRPPSDVTGQAATKVWAASILSEAHHAYRAAKRKAPRRPKRRNRQEARHDVR